MGHAEKISVEMPCNESGMFDTAVYRNFIKQEFIVNVTVACLVLFISYWIIGIMCSIVDLTGKPQFIANRKTVFSKSDENPRVTPERLWQVISVVLFNQTIVNIPAVALCFALRSWRGYSNEIIVPGVTTLIYEVILNSIIGEISVYYMHRMLHYPPIYKRYHKLHHEWTSPIAATDLYVHPVEHIFENMVSMQLGSVLLGTHAVSLWISLAISTVFGVASHSGYNLPLLPSPEFHEFHHVKFTGNYGFTGLMDRFHGTDSEYRKWRLKRVEKSS